MSELIRFIVWFVKKHEDNIFWIAYFLILGIFGVVVSPVFADYTGLTTVEMLVVWGICAVISILAWSVVIVVFGSAYLWCVEQWEAYRKDYPARKRKQHDA